ncbi:MAG: DUF3048 domain-containing protein [Patescibacteria group bacterium]|nr:DUF3048 domain-containing protein [Patescibacteria group bacterium]
MNQDQISQEQMDEQNNDQPQQMPGEYFYRPDEERKEQKNKNPWIVILIVIVLIVTIFGWWFLRLGDEKKRGTPIEINNEDDGRLDQNALNKGEVSPISGLACENWKRRPLAIMQPADVDARPAAGFSQADMVIEMPVITAGITRLMGIYICDLPTEAGSMRSARHDFIHLAKGLDAIFVSWGRSETHDESDSIGMAKGILNRLEIDNINCNGDAGKSANECSKGASACFRKEGFARGVDSGYSRPGLLFECAREFGYETEGRLGGYAHQMDVPLESRIERGHLRVGYAGKYAVEYDYDRETNSYLRSWGGNPDIDRNNGKRLAPKNIVVMMAKSEQTKDDYNNVQLGDPWYDSSDSGEALYYIDGHEIRGKWKKDKSRIDSKLQFLNNSGEDIKFVPGQIWVQVLEPGQKLKWKTDEDV